MLGSESKNSFLDPNWAPKPLPEENLLEYAKALVDAMGMLLECQEAPVGQKFLISEDQTRSNGSPMSLRPRESVVSPQCLLLGHKEGSPQEEQGCGHGAQRR